MNARDTISPGRWARLVKSFRGRRIAVVGDWMLDRYVWGTASRLSPEAAVPVVDFVEQKECLGGAGNVAANLAALGARVEGVGVHGEDEPGKALRACLRALALPERGVLTDAARPTTVKTRIMAQHQQVVRVDREVNEPLRPEIESQVIRRVLASLGATDVLVLSDYAKGVVTDSVAERILGACQRRGVPAFVKPKRSRLQTYKGAAAIVCNRDEAGFLVARPLDDDESVCEAGRALLAHFGCPTVVITRGNRGMSVFEQDHPAGFHIAATSRELPYGRLGQPGADRSISGRQVFDVTGAGDTVLATLALAVAAGAGIREAALAANAAAGVVVGKLGTASVSPAELLVALREMPAAGRKHPRSGARKGRTRR